MAEPIATIAPGMEFEGEGASLESLHSPADVDQVVAEAEVLAAAEAIVDGAAERMPTALQEIEEKVDEKTREELGETHMGGKNGGTSDTGVQPKYHYV